MASSFIYKRNIRILISVLLIIALILIVKSITEFVGFSQGILTLISTLLSITCIWILFRMINDIAKIKNVYNQKNLNYTPPVPFGHKSVWMAVKTNDPELVVNTFFRDKKVICTNWESCYFGHVEKGYSYVLQPIDGWVIVQGIDIYDLLQVKNPNAILF